jgi:hypothetical protein
MIKLAIVPIRIKETCIIEEADMSLPNSLLIQISGASKGITVYFAYETSSP